MLKVNDLEYCFLNYDIENLEVLKGLIGDGNVWTFGVKDVEVTLMDFLSSHYDVMPYSIKMKTLNYLRELTDFKKSLEEDIYCLERKETKENKEIEDTKQYFTKDSLDNKNKGFSDNLSGTFRQEVFFSGEEAEKEEKSKSKEKPMDPLEEIDKIFKKFNEIKEKDSKKPDDSDLTKKDEYKKVAKELSKEIEAIIQIGDCIDKAIKYYGGEKETKDSKDTKDSKNDKNDKDDNIVNIKDLFDLALDLFVDGDD